MAVDHLVLLAADRLLLTEELRQDFLTLCDRVRSELGIPLENRVVFSETERASVVGILSHWRFQSQEDLTRFRESRAHLEHLERVKPILKGKQVLDLQN